MPRTVITDTATGRIEFVKAGEPAADLTAYLNAYGAAGHSIYNMSDGLVPDNVNELLDMTYSGTVLGRYVPSTAVVRAEHVTDWKLRLSRAYNLYQDGTTAGGRRGWWPSLRSGSNADRPLRATDRWAYQQIAIGSQIADRVAFTALTDEQRETAIAHLATLIGSIGEIWYGVMVGQEAQPGGGYSADWADASVADGAICYSDLITSTGGVRSPDGRFLAIVVTIPSGFKPDTPTLR